MALGKRDDDSENETEDVSWSLKIVLKMLKLVIYERNELPTSLNNVTM